MICNNGSQNSNQPNSPPFRRFHDEMAIGFSIHCVEDANSKLFGDMICFIVDGFGMHIPMHLVFLFILLSKMLKAPTPKYSDLSFIASLRSLKRHPNMPPLKTQMPKPIIISSIPLLKAYKTQMPKYLVVSFILLSASLRRNFFYCQTPLSLLLIVENIRVSMEWTTPLILMLFVWNIRLSKE